MVMENWISIFMLVLEISALFYLLIMLIISIGWYTTLVFVAKEGDTKKSISVVVAIRNEADKIGKLLDSIKRQSYPKDKFELIIVDDKSDDDSRSRVNNFIEENPQLEIKLINSKGEGKKAAIKTAVNYSANDIVVCTDGDCMVSKDWLRNYASFFENDDVKLVFAAVFYKQSNRLIEKLFSLEFMSLVASGAGSSGMGLTLMGNGANIGFSKQAFLEVVSKMKGDKYASGDDVFLMHSIASTYGKKAVRFLKSNDCVVDSPAPKSLKEFVKQRIRWGSKAKAYKNQWPVFVSLTVLLFNIGLVITFFMAFYESWIFVIYALFVLLKTLIDIPLLLNFQKFYDRKASILMIIGMEIIYPFYIIYAAFSSIFIPYEWKGRKRVK